jgi:hypothetical protein
MFILLLGYDQQLKTFSPRIGLSFLALQLSVKTKIYLSHSRLVFVYFLLGYDQQVQNIHTKDLIVYLVTLAVSNTYDLSPQ